MNIRKFGPRYRTRDLATIEEEEERERKRAGKQQKKNAGHKREK